MKEMLFVGLGGFIGSVGRYKLSGFVLQQVPDWRFPLGTLAVNLVGCFIIGLLSGWAGKHQLGSPELRLFLVPGLLGGFTTFSAFGFETFHLMRRGELHIAFLYVALSVVCGLGLVWLGFRLTGGGSQSI